MSLGESKPNFGRCESEEIRAESAPATNVDSYRHVDEKAAPHGAAFSHLGDPRRPSRCQRHAHSQGLVHSALEFPSPHQLEPNEHLPALKLGPRSYDVLTTAMRLVAWRPQGKAHPNDRNRENSLSNEFLCVGAHKGSGEPHDNSPDGHGYFPLHRH